MNLLLKRTLKLTALIIFAYGILIVGMYVHEEPLLLFGARNINDSRHFPDPVFHQQVDWYMNLYKKGKPFSEYQASIQKKRFSIGLILPTGKLFIATLNGIEYFKSLEELDCRDCTIHEIDLRKNINLIHLSFSDVSVDKIQFPAGDKLESLSINNSQCGAIDLSIFPNLQHLVLNNCKLKTLDLSKCPQLVELVCTSNQIAALDLSKTPKLQRLLCDENLLTALDLTSLKDLLYLSCATNQIAVLDVSQNVNLTTLICNNNQIKTITIGGLREIKNLKCSFNQIDNIQNFLALPWLWDVSIEQNNLDQDDATDVLKIKTKIDKLSSESGNPLFRISYSPQKSADPYVLSATP